MRLIDADALLDTTNWLVFADNKVDVAYVQVADIMRQPTVDAVPVIRCKECKYHRGENACEKDGCYGWYDTDYCSRAERKEE